MSAAATPVDFETYGTIYHPRNVKERVKRPGPANSTLEEVYPFNQRISPTGPFPPEAGRYHLFVSYACPIAHRSLIVRALKGLEDVIGVSVVDPYRDGRGWAFRDVPGATLDTSGEGFRFLAEAYDVSAPDGDYRGHISVPVLWDRQSHRIVANYYPTISLDIGSQFNEFATRNAGLDLYPVDLQPELDELLQQVATGLNGGVYAAGFTYDQAQHAAAARGVWDTLAELEKRLSDGRRYLFGDRLTEADIRTWVTLVRFDTVYHGHFKLTWRRLSDYPRLWAYTRRLYAIPAFGETTKLDHIIHHYYGTQRQVNPSGVVPALPDIDWTPERDDLAPVVS
ncbi:MAG: glutathione S-transferase C-terminal domain-containing protein [Propionibacteriaceae bacterium]|nr:glutathione S-transferase C-terminal domain-containing protein [Propionibacteriaceae bacterium]